MDEQAYERGVFELSAEPLQPERCAARLLDARCGALVAFTGLTRANNRGQSVLRLEYQAFERMSGPEMGRIFARCLEQHPATLLRMLVVHRVGVVGVGEPSVWVGVASPHRAPAFAACQWLIDELKASLPIWKKEIYNDGSHWIGDRS